jgi:hypothetical protein
LTVYGSISYVLTRFDTTCATELGASFSENINKHLIFVWTAFGTFDALPVVRGHAV